MKKRHTCIICKKKRYEENMKNVFLNSWACSVNIYMSYLDYMCYEHNDIRLVKKILELKSQLKVVSLNNYI